MGTIKLADALNDSANITKTIKSSASTPIEFTDTVWDDLRFPASTINPPGGVNDADVDTSGAFTGTLLFDAAATEEIAGQFQMPHKWKEGTAIHPHVHWSPTSTNTGNVLWRFSYQMANPHGTFPGTLTTIDILDAADGTTNKHQMVDIGEIDMTGKAISVMCVWILQRVGGDANDTYTADARLLEFDVHYEIDGVGSSTEYTK